MITHIFVLKVCNLYVLEGVRSQSGLPFGDGWWHVLEGFVINLYQRSANSDGFTICSRMWNRPDKGHKAAVIKSSVRAGAAWGIFQPPAEYSHYSQWKWKNFQRIIITSNGAVSLSDNYKMREIIVDMITETRDTLLPARAVTVTFIK